MGSGFGWHPVAGRAPIWGVNSGGQFGGLLSGKKKTFLERPVRLREAVLYRSMLRTKTRPVPEPGNVPQMAQLLGFRGASWANSCRFFACPPPSRTGGVAIAGFHILAHPKLDASENFLNISVTLEGRLT